MIYPDNLNLDKYIVLLTRKCFHFYYCILFNMSDIVAIVLVISNIQNDGKERKSKNKKSFITHFYRYFCHYFMFLLPKVLFDRLQIANPQLLLKRECLYAYNCEFL